MLLTELLVSGEDEVIANEALAGTFPYLDDVTICEKNQTEHDYNLKRFMTAVRQKNLTSNEEKCVFIQNLLHY